MPTSLQSRTQYLTLAEFCQSLIAGLMDYADQDSAALAASLKMGLRRTLQSLEAISSGQLHALARAKSAPLATFDQVRTLQEVWNTAELAGVADGIRNLLANDTGRGRKLHSAERLIDQFTKLQMRALWNFRQPTQALPKSFRELCRAL
jgi:hypothetical protein